MLHEFLDLERKKNFDFCRCRIIRYRSHKCKHKTLKQNTIHLILFNIDIQAIRIESNPKGYEGKTEEDIGNEKQGFCSMRNERISYFPGRKGNQVGSSIALHKVMVKIDA